jgi:DUF971 family protein
MHVTPNRIQLHKKSKQLELQFGLDSYSLSSEYLRVHSPSAEVRGHGNATATLQHGKLHVAITHIEAAGNYGLRIFFDDEHSSGIYNWELLYRLSTNQIILMQKYEDNLKQAGKFRDPDTSTLPIIQ